MHVSHRQIGSDKLLECLFTDEACASTGSRRQFSLWRFCPSKQRRLAHLFITGFWSWREGPRVDSGLISPSLRGFPPEPPTVQTFWSSAAGQTFIRRHLFTAERQTFSYSFISVEMSLKTSTSCLCPQEATPRSRA